MTLLPGVGDSRHYAFRGGVRVFVSGDCIGALGGVTEYGLPMGVTRTGDPYGF